MSVSQSIWFRFLTGVACTTVLLTQAACDTTSPAAVTFVRGSTADGWQVFEVSAAGSSVPRLRVTDVVGLLDYSIDNSGNRIATSSTSGGLEVRDSSGVPLYNLPHLRPHGLDWTADGRWLVFEEKGAIWVVDPDRGWLQLTPDPVMSDPAAQFAARPRWSATGERIFFIRYRIAQDTEGHQITTEHEIWSIARDGSDPRRVYSGVPEPTRLNLAASRDDSALVFDTDGEPGPYLVRLELATGATSRLGIDGTQPAFSGTGVELAYIWDDQVWTCQYAGNACTSPTRLTQGRPDRTPGWVRQ